jgi:hypothetical protein
MIIKKFKRLAAGVLTMAALFAINPIAAHAEWRKDNTGWWYANGNSWYTGWKQVDGKWYFFDSKGYMAHNRYVDNYYLNSNGVWDGSSQSFSVTYPSSWVKSTSNGSTIYLLDNKLTSVQSETATTQGKTPQQCIDYLVTKLKSVGVNEVNTSQQVINGKTAYVLDYSFKDTKSNADFKLHQVIFFNNNQAYIFSICALGNISSSNIDSFNNMLKTITF